MKRTKDFWVGVANSIIIIGFIYAVAWFMVSLIQTVLIIGYWLYETNQVVSALILLWLVFKGFNNKRRER